MCCVGFEISKICLKLLTLLFFNHCKTGSNLNVIEDILCTLGSVDGYVFVVEKKQILDRFEWDVLYTIFMTGEL